MTTALLIIDMQRALCSGEEAAFDIQNLVERINALSSRARDSNSPVFLIQHEEEDGPLQYDSEGWSLTDELLVSAGDVRVRKKTPNSFHETNLHKLLQGHGAGRIVLCGLQTEFCVDTTVRQALPLGYHVVLASDAHSTTDGVLKAKQIIAHHNHTLQYMTSYGPLIEVKPAAEVTFET